MTIFKGLECNNLLFQLWKIVKVILDIILFVISTYPISGKCMNSPANIVYSIYVFCIAIVFMLSSICEFIVYNNENVKKIILQALCCDLLRSNAKIRTEKVSLIRIAYFVIMVPLGFLYLLVFALII